MLYKNFVKNKNKLSFKTSRAGGHLDTILFLFIRLVLVHRGNFSSTSLVSLHPILGTDDYKNRSFRRRARSPLNRFAALVGNWSTH